MPFEHRKAAFPWFGVRHAGVIIAASALLAVSVGWVRWVARPGPQTLLLWWGALVAGVAPGAVMRGVARVAGWTVGAVLLLLSVIVYRIIWALVDPDAGAYSPPGSRGNPAE